MGGGLCLSLSWYAFLCVLFKFAIILKRKRELVALLLLSYGCLATVNVLWLYFTAPWVGLQCVIVVFPDHIYFLLWNLNVGNPCKAIWFWYVSHMCTPFKRQCLRIQRG